MGIEHLKKEYVEAGGDLTSRSIQRKLKHAEQQANKEARAAFKTGNKERVTTRIQNMLALLAVFFVGSFLVVGNIATIIMFPIAEFVAVRRGIMSFEAHSFIASFNAATLTIGYVVLLFVKYLLRDNLPATQRLYRNIRYTILFIQIAIVLFGFLGRTVDNLEANTVGIIEIIGYSGTLVLTIALLAVTDITILFVYSIFVNNVGVLNINGGDKEAFLNFLEARKEELQTDILTDQIIMLNVIKRESNSLQE